MCIKTSKTFISCIPIIRVESLKLPALLACNSLASYDTQGALRVCACVLQYIIALLQQSSSKKEVQESSTGYYIEKEAQLCTVEEKARRQKEAHRLAEDKALLDERKKLS